MKVAIAMELVLVLFLHSFVSCKNNSSAHKIKIDSVERNLDTSISKADQLFSDGMNILNERISVQSSNREKAMQLNEQVIKKFTEAYKADTSLRDPIFYASECTMFARDYKECIFWTIKLKQVDTSSSNLEFCADRIKYCNKKLKSKAED